MTQGADKPMHPSFRLKLKKTLPDILYMYVCVSFYPHKLAITSPTSGGRSVGIVRSQTQTMEFKFFMYVCGLPLWSSGQSSWLQIRRPGFDSRHYQRKKVVGQLSLVSTTEELLGRKHSGSGQENREYGRKDPSRWPRGTLYPHKLAIASPTSGDRSVGIVRSRTQAMEFSF
jgi:hypothetical protein